MGGGRRLLPLQVFLLYALEEGLAQGIYGSWYIHQAPASSSQSGGIAHLLYALSVLFSSITTGQPTPPCGLTPHGAACHKIFVDWRAVKSRRLYKVAKTPGMCCTILQHLPE